MASLTPSVAGGQAEKQAVSAAKALAGRVRGGRRTQGDLGRLSGTPVLAYETVVGGFQD
ncbi:hypothetical protein [Streptomyces sp. KL116D]|uniref:hypothetical protein n=1 Tax=Streptomyces sp. KL116D TaxID=3045152 RepID=UPI00355915DD